MRKCYVYIMTNRSKTLYVGVTNSLARRVQEHKKHQALGFTKKHNIDQLIYYEDYDNPNDAISREKQIKGWLRIKKLKLIESLNPNWNDLSLEIMDD